MLFQEQIAHTRGLLQSLDPRAKLFCTLALLVLFSIVDDLWLLGKLYAGLFVLAVFSRIDPLLFVKRVWLVVPLFTGIVVLPATLSWVTPGNPVWVIYEFKEAVRLGPATMPQALAVTDTGIHLAARFVLRVADSISAVLLLVLTTPWQKLLRSLRVLRVPHFIVFALGMSYRYMQLLVRLLLDLHLARRSRTLRRSRWTSDQAWLGSRAGYLFKRSLGLSESVYHAMLSRGFQGEPKVLDDLRWQMKDVVAIVAVLAFCTVLALLRQ
jgi:cobalt/nickel transport system permease protein